MAARVDTYYFDGHDGISDPDSAWSNETNAVDGSTNTYTSTGTDGSEDFGYLKIDGTTAPDTLHGPISLVRARVHDGSDWGDYVTLDAPADGWAWINVRGLESRAFYDNSTSRMRVAIYADGDSGGTIIGQPSSGIVSLGEEKISKIEIEVTSTFRGDGASDKQYLYKVYRNNKFVGTLKNVISDFSYTYGVNEAFTEITIEIGNSLEDAGASFDKDFIVDESGDNLIDENGDNLLSRLDTVFDNIPIDIGNELRVFEISDDYPAGTPVFSGVISKWRARTNSKDNIIITALSYGVQLDNFIFNKLAETAAIAVSSSDSTVQITTPTDPDVTSSLAQTIQPSEDLSVNSIQVHMYGATTEIDWFTHKETLYTKVDVEVVQGTPQAPGSSLVKLTNVLVPPSPAADQIFLLPSTVSLTSGETYHIKITPKRGVLWTPSITVSYDSTNPYADGALYQTTDSGENWSAVGGDLRFQVNSGEPSINPSFSSTQPSDMLKSALDAYNTQGGIITYTDDSIEDTGTTASYSFVLATYLEAAEIVRKLSPGAWYWYVDPGTNIFYLKQKSVTANHTFVFGKHIHELDIERSLENVRNLIYFSGGDTGAGKNLLKVTSDTGSLDANGQWLERISDNRVTLDSSATLISENALREPSYNAYVTILAKDYDIHSINPGDVVAFANTNEFIQSLNLQVVRLTRRPDSITLYLDSFLPLINKRVEDLRRQLDSVVTINSPDTAS